MTTEIHWLNRKKHFEDVGLALSKGSPQFDPKTGTGLFRGPDTWEALKNLGHSDFKIDFCECRNRKILTVGSR